MTSPKEHLSDLYRVNEVTDIGLLPLAVESALAIKLGTKSTATVGILN